MASWMLFSGKGVARFSMECHDVGYTFINRIFEDYIFGTCVTAPHHTKMNKSVRVIRGCSERHSVHDSFCSLLQSHTNVSKTM
jgi:hypothetical protein